VSGEGMLSEVAQGRRNHSAGWASVPPSFWPMAPMGACSTNFRWGEMAVRIIRWRKCRRVPVC